MLDQTYANHLETLGLTPGATSEDIRKAWKKAVRACHPDVIGASGEEEIKRIMKAYDALKNRPLDDDTFMDDVDERQTFVKRSLYLNHQRYSLSRDIQGDLHERATIDTMVTLGVHVPHTIITEGKHLNYVLDVITLRQGDTVALPTLVLTNGNLTIDVDHPITFSVQSEAIRGWSKTLIADKFDEAVVGYKDAVIWISSADE
jgi:hypothetical protein